MAKKKKSALSKALGNKGQKALNAHKSDETEFDTGGSLPAGIEGGVAQLVDCKFGEVAEGKENAGKPYFYAAGIVHEPKEHGGVPIEGRRTSITEPLYDTPTRSRKDVDDHMDWILNELRKLGVDTEELNDLDELDATASALKDDGPYFRFRTWKGEKQTTGPYAGREPRTQEVWSGIIEDYEPPEDDDEVEEDDDEPEDDDTEDENEGEEDDTAEDSDDGEEGDDLEALGKEADDEDEDAQERLTELAEEAELDPGDFKTWAKLATALAKLSDDEDGDDDEGEDDDSEGDDDEGEPEKGGVYKWKPPKKKKAIDVEVTAVQKKKQTVTVKDLATDKTFKGVDWEKLEEAD